MKAMLFVEFLQVALGNLKTLSVVPSKQDWHHLFAMAQKQTLIGVCFKGIQRLPPEQTVYLPPSLKMKWLGITANIQRRNEVLNERCVEISRLLLSEGYTSCILKGQGNAAMYGNDLSKLRQPGDIDVWVPCGMNKAMEFCRKRYGNVMYDYINAHISEFQDVEVELHWKPQAMTNLCMNKKLQRWFGSEEVRKMMLGGRIKLANEHEINIPLSEFNAFYQMLHCYHHMFESGLGLRQLMDYYFLLLHINSQGNNIKKSLIKSRISEYGMKKFASAIMWILGEVFGLKREYMLFYPNEREGRFILNEIMQSGNFGHYDNRMHSIRNKWIAPFATRIQHNWHLATHYPSEFFWAPVWLIYHFFWKRTLSN